MEKKVENVKNMLFSRQFCYFRLHHAFSHLTATEEKANGEKTNKKEKNDQNFFFFTDFYKKSKNPSLFFVFDNGIDPDPKFSGPVFAKLYIDKEKRLVLKTAPYKKTTSFFCRKEILLHHVDSWNFVFYFLKNKANASDGSSSDTISAPDLTNTSNATAVKSVKDINTKKEILKSSSLWEKKEKTLPLMFQIDIKISSQEKPLSFAFFFPSEKQPLIIP
jgi:hypothetical protein